MNKLLYICGLVLVVLMAACTENPLKDIEDTNSWQKERNVVSILIEGQMGTAVINREFDDAKIKIFAKLENIADISKVEIKDIQLAYGATTDNGAGTFLDFTNEVDHISVVSGAGETLEWEVTISAFVSDLEGTWYIKEMGAYCDMFTWESWGWEEYIQIPEYLPESASELDDVFTFEVEGADENGNPFGKYIHAAGNDGIYGEFTDDAKGWDYNSRYRNVPTGEGTWLRDFERNKVIITDGNNVAHELDFEMFEDEDEVALNSDLPYTPENFDWNNTDWSYEKVANMSKKMWYRFTKERVIQTGNSITSISVKDQVGDAVIDNDNHEVTVIIENNGADLSSIELLGLGVSYGATADKNEGDMLDFSTDNSTQITVTSEAQEAQEWTVKVQIDLDAGDVSIVGTWDIADINVYCDLFTWESWGWDKTELLTNYLSSLNKELDNTITFNLDGANGEGQPYGTYEHNSGADGEYGTFVSDDASWPETDFNSRYRKVPTGNGTWVLDGETVKITDAGGTEFELTLEVKSETEVALTTPIEYLSELFNWDNTNYSYEEVAHMSNKMWYNLNKQ